MHVCRDLRLAERAPHAADPVALSAPAAHRLAETAGWQRRLQNLENRAAEDARVQSWVVRGRPAAALPDAAAELDSDAILVGSTAATPLAAGLDDRKDGRT
jgi:nucleotide-binding universal stress UspA family protein